MILVDGRSSSHTTEASFRDAPSSSKHLYPPAEGSSEADFPRWRRIRSCGCLHVLDHESIRHLIVIAFVPSFLRLLRLRLGIGAEVILLEGLQTLVGAVVGRVLCKKTNDWKTVVRDFESIFRE